MKCHDSYFQTPSDVVHPKSNVRRVTVRTNDCNSELSSAAFIPPPPGFRPANLAAAELCFPRVWWYSLRFSVKFCVHLLFRSRIVHTPPYSSDQSTPQSSVSLFFFILQLFRTQTQAQDWSLGGSGQVSQVADTTQKQNFGSKVYGLFPDCR